MAYLNQELCRSTLNEIEECLTSMKEMSLVPFPIYENMNKSAAYVCYRLKEYESAAFYLSEAHGGGIRSKPSLTINPNDSNNEKLDECLSLKSKYVTEGIKGLMERLQEMPSEWTLVQITRNYDPKEIVTPRPANKPIDVSELFVTRYQCGDKYKNNQPLTTLVDKPSGMGPKSLFEILKQSLDDTNNNQCKNAVAARKLRDAASQSIKSVSHEIHTSWLRHWICMLFGNYVDEKLSSEVYSVIDTVLEKENLTISERAKMLLYQITNAAVQLTEDEVNKALGQLELTELEISLFAEALKVYRLNGSHLMLKKRHPVLLILDEHLECLPWESIPCLKRHPLSRVSSVHLVHMLYNKHKDFVQNGLMKVKGQGYYVINPDKTLTNAEKRITLFLKERNVDWEGMKSVEPAPEQFRSLLQKNGIVLYCGHGNGTQYLHSCDLEKLDLRCIPMLFGCSSAKHTDKGGRCNFVGASYGYLKAGCPSLIGMLWNVTSLDADNLARAILNVWLPGEPIDLQNKWPKEFLDSQDFKPEPELLRTLAIARKTTRSFFNSAALVARGIPVIMTK